MFTYYGSLKKRYSHLPKIIQWKCLFVARFREINCTEIIKLRQSSTSCFFVL
jgi:hypothetical protein